MLITNSHSLNTLVHFHAFKWGLEFKSNKIVCIPTKLSIKFETNYNILELHQKFAPSGDFNVLGPRVYTRTKLGEFNQQSTD